MQKTERFIHLENGKTISIEVGRLARQADGSAVVRCGDTMLLATATAKREINPETDFLPLTVDYLEKYASSGKIPGGFFKREGRPGDGEILVSRLVDRALRPLFPEDYHGDTQVIIQLISWDPTEPSDQLACIAATAALMVSDIPFPEPVSEVRVVRKEGKLIVNPCYADIQGADIEIMVAGTNDSIVMVEGEMNEVSEEDMLEAFKLAHQAIKTINKGLEDLRKEFGKPTREYETIQLEAQIQQKMRELCEAKVKEVVYGILPKQERSKKFSEIYDAAMEVINPLYEGNEEVNVSFQAGMIFKELKAEVMRNMVLNDGVRLDGRKTDEIRPIWSEVGYLPRAHGSSLFTRGETQSLCTVTLGSKLDEQTIDRPTEIGSKRFMLNYNFPGFSTGEVKPLRSPGRREVGHGNLAERALKVMVPSDFDYTVRVVSDILESNGSSSMATVCGGCLALMDAGVPVKNAVSGIAMGLITSADNSRWAVLSDILGDEDALGDMDFKVAGTEKGLTACQMDIKVRGLSYDVLAKALDQSRRGRMHILGKMLETLSKPRTEMSPYAPRILRMEIPTDFIGAVIGPGGKVIQEMQKKTGTTIVIEEVNNRGVITISSTNLDGMAAAERMIKAITTQPEVGDVYDAKVKSIKEFGAFVEFLPGKEGLLHISEISYDRLGSMEGVMEVGDEFKIKIIGVDPKTGKFRLSKKALLPRPEGMPEEDGEEGGGGYRGGGGGGGGRFGGRGGGGGGGRGHGGGHGNSHSGPRNRNPRDN